MSAPPPLSLLLSPSCPPLLSHTLWQFAGLRAQPCYPCACPPASDLYHARLDAWSASNPHADRANVLPDFTALELALTGVGDGPVPGGLSLRSSGRTAAVEAGLPVESGDIDDEYAISPGLIGLILAASGDSIALSTCHTVGKVLWEYAKARAHALRGPQSVHTHAQAVVTYAAYIAAGLCAGAAPVAFLAQDATLGSSSLSGEVAIDGNDPRTLQEPVSALQCSCCPVHAASSLVEMCAESSSRTALACASLSIAQRSLFLPTAPLLPHLNAALSVAGQAWDPQTHVPPLEKMIGEVLVCPEWRSTVGDPHRFSFCLPSRLPPGFPHSNLTSFAMKRLQVLIGCMAAEVSVRWGVHIPIDTAEDQLNCLASIQRALARLTK